MSFVYSARRNFFLYTSLIQQFQSTLTLHRHSNNYLGPTCFWILQYLNNSLLQSAARIVTKCGSFLLSQSAAKNCYKVRQLSLLQSAAKFVTKCGSCYKVRQNLLQSAAVVTKCGNCYKVEHNSNNFVTNYFIRHFNTRNSLNNGIICTVIRDILQI